MAHHLFNASTGPFYVNLRIYRKRKPSNNPIHWFDTSQSMAMISGVSSLASLSFKETLFLQHLKTMIY